MNIIKTTFLKLLQGNVIYNDDIVPVVIKDYWIDMTPCITITGLSRDKGKYHRHQRTIHKKVPSNHRLFDEENPNRKYPFLAEYTRKSYEIHINVWCNDEREREIIVNQVRELLFLARNHYYKFCINYDKDTHKCSTLNEECKARTDTIGYRELRGLCPAPCKYEYCNLLKANGILPSTVHISPDYEADEYDHRPPLKRSIIDINLDYYDIFIYDSNPMECYYISVDADSIDETKLLTDLLKGL